ncbi:MAG TPA: hypothetical protein VGR37_13105 [Longimicrobiaceae bacterium]|nr:hypothetical protein [Longimicrobiaceae bacterium]
MPVDTDTGSARETVQAVVLAGTSRIPYRRAGSGEHVLLLQGAAQGGDAPPLLAAVARRFRVFVPELPGDGRPGDAPLAARLRGFLDGAGLRRVHLVADEASAAEALWLALSEPERVHRLAIVLAENADPAFPAGLPLERFAQSGQPLLVVRREAAPRDGGGAGEASADERIVRFLAGGAEGDAAAGK